MPNDVRADEGLGFDNVPEIYDRIRPTYPPALFTELFRYLTPSDTGRAVEIGPGTGQATQPLLEHGLSVTAIEPGEQLAAFLRRKLGPKFPLEVVTSKFEDLEVEPGSYDLVLAATSFHWLDPAHRFPKCHDLLTGGGTLAIIDTNQIASNADQGFFSRAQPIYDRHQPTGPTAPASPTEDELTPPGHDELVACGLFADIRVHRFRWDQTYTSAQYGDLMRSYSGTQAMKPTDQEAMIRDICALIDREFDGRITRPLVMSLTLGRKIG